ncbi:MAG: TraR/DksA family transcriptional regulator [Vibrio sp.]
MTDQFDRAQQLEQEFRDRAIAQQLKRNQDAACAEGEDRDCVDCGVAIPQKRIQAMPSAVRCVGCQSKKEPH